MSPAQIRSQLKTRRPTGKPTWPMLLLAGGEKCGKSYSAAALSTSDLVDRTFWIEIGEGSADLYGAMPGARYEIVEHDGSYPSLLDTAEAIVAIPRGASGKPHAIVVDSVTELWDLLGNEQASIAKQRGKDTITMDQWNAAKRRWRRFLDTLRKHDGPVIFTARFEQVTVVIDGKPATVDGRKNGAPLKEWKVRAEKNLPFEVDGVVQIPHPRQYFLTGMRTMVPELQVPSGGNLRLPDAFSLDAFFRKLGLGTESTGQRNYVAPREDEQMVQQDASSTASDDAADEGGPMNVPAPSGPDPWGITPDDALQSGEAS